MRVRVNVEEIELDGDYAPVPSVCVTCTKCGESVEVFGQSVSSVRRGCVMLREGCSERNFYVAGSEHDYEEPAIDYEDYDDDA